ncbi:MAG: glycosyltransferase family 92 protein [Betaproteobacteria bacterium]|nr:glycosyltransferase family 92 protein [Betaproteobacteria bacterium]
MGLRKKFKKFLHRTQRVSAAERARLSEIESAFPRIMTFEEMLVRIKAGASLARFSEVEFNTALYRMPQYAKVSRRLHEILTRPSDGKLILSIPPFNPQYGNVERHYKDLSFWQDYWLNMWVALEPLLNCPLYGNSFFTHKSAFHEISVKELTDIWSDRDVVFVMPNNCRLVFDEDMFRNVKSRTYVNFQSSSYIYDEYDNVLSECLAHSKDKLFLVSGGVIACLLAAGLSGHGYQALDMACLHSPRLTTNIKIDKKRTIPKIMMDKLFNIFCKNKPFLAAMLCAKNEGLYIREWIEYHRLVGVEKFFIYDNESTDNTREILQPYVDEGIVEYKFWRGVKQQLEMYADGFRRYSYSARWLAVIDTDEFLVPESGGTIPDAIRRIKKQFPNGQQILSPWIMFGTSGHVVRPEGLVIEHYTKCMPLTRHEHKAIVNPRLVKSVRSAHIFTLCLGDTITQDGINFFENRYPLSSQEILPHPEIRINHYWTKSVEEYRKRNILPDVITGSASIRSDDALAQIEKDSTITDEAMHIYLDRLKKALE